MLTMTKTGTLIGGGSAISESSVLALMPNMGVKFSGANLTNAGYASGNLVDATYPAIDDLGDVFNSNAGGAYAVWSSVTKNGIRSIVRNTSNSYARHSTRTNSAMVGGGASGASMTVFIVAQMTGSQGVSSIYGNNGTLWADANLYYGFGFGGSGGSDRRMGLSVYTSNYFSTTSTLGFTDGAPYVACFKTQYVNPNILWTMTLNQSQQTGSYNAGGTPAFPTGNKVEMRFVNSGTHIYEVWAGPDLVSDLDILTVNQFLMNKYGIA